MPGWPRKRRKNTETPTGLQVRPGSRFDETDRLRNQLWIDSRINRKYGRLAVLASDHLRVSIHAAIGDDFLIVAQAAMSSQ